MLHTLQALVEIFCFNGFHAKKPLKKEEEVRKFEQKLEKIHILSIPPGGFGGFIPPPKKKKVFRGKKCFQVQKGVKHCFIFFILELLKFEKIEL